MPLYLINAKRQISYEIEVEADTPEQAIEEVNRIEQAEDIEEYAYEWGSLDIEEMEELGEEE